MKRNGRNQKMPKGGVITSNEWSRMTNLQRYDFMKKLTYDKKKKIWTRK